MAEKNLDERIKELDKSDDNDTNNNTNNENHQLERKKIQEMPNGTNGILSAARDQQVINFSCVTKEAVPTKGIIGELFDLFKKLLIGIFVIITLVCLLALYIYMKKGRNAFVAFWNYSFGIIGKVFKMQGDLLDKLVPG